MSTSTAASPLPKLEEIKLIVSDVDGTLLDSKHELPSSNLNHVILRRIRTEHPSLPIVISTGKPYPATESLREQLDLNGFNAIHLNGNVLYAPGGRIISQTGLDTKLVLEVYETLKKAGTSLFIYDTDRPWHVLPFATAGDKPWDSALRAYGEDVQMLDRAEEAMDRIRSGEFKVVKMAVCEIESYLPTVRNALSVFPETTFSITQALPFCIELIPAKFNKGTALLSLLDHLNSGRPLPEQILPNQVIAFGDGGNDVSMLEIAGMSVAMGNAMPAATRTAKWQTGTNDEGGVGLFLEKIFFPSSDSA